MRVLVYHSLKILRKKNSTDGDKTCDNLLLLAGLEPATFRFSKVSFSKSMYQFNICSAVSSFFVRKVIMTTRFKGTWNNVFKTTGSLCHLLYIDYKSPQRSSIVLWWFSPPITRDTGVRFPPGRYFLFLQEIRKIPIFNQRCVTVQIVLEMIERGLFKLSYICFCS